MEAPFSILAKGHNWPYQNAKNIFINFLTPESEFPHYIENLYTFDMLHRQFCLMSKIETGNICG